MIALFILLAPLTFAQTASVSKDKLSKPAPPGQHVPATAAAPRAGAKSQAPPPVTTDTWTGGGSDTNWSDNSNWNNGAPSGQNVVIGNSFNTNEDDNASIGTLSLGTSGSVTLLNNTILTAGGNISNNGTIALSSFGNYTELYVGASLTLSGTGSIILGFGGPNVITGASGTVLTNNSTISGGAIVANANIGNGAIGIVNNRTINANVSGTNLFLYPAAAAANSNTKTLEATSGGTLVMYGGSWTNTGGTISAAASSGVDLSNGVSITGGTLTSTGTGAIYSGSSNNAYLTGVTISNGTTYDIQNNSATFISGTITNNGTINLQSGGNNTYLDVVSTGRESATLAGTGTVVMGTGGPNYIDGPSGGSLINQEKITGGGNIGEGNLTLTNSSTGTINANLSPTVSVEPLYIQPGTGGMVNAGKLEATNGGTLYLNGGAINNTGTIQAVGADTSNNASTVFLGNSVSINGGTLGTSGAGIIVNLSGQSAYLTNLTNSGTYQVQNGAQTILAGTITNNGTITLSGNSCVALNEASTLTGSGKLAMGSTNCILGSGLPFTNQSTIQGAGSIGGSNPMPITNTGTILANASTPLTVNSGTYGFTNTGTLEVNSGSTLDITGLFNNLSGTGTLSGGAYAVMGTLGLPGGIVSNAASVTLRGATAEILNSSTSTNALAAVAANATTGTLSLQSGQALATNANFSNSGKTTVGLGSSFTVGGTYTQTVGTTTVDGTLTAPSGMTLNKGSLVGKGSISAAVTLSGGSVTAGDSSTKPGTLTITGSYTQQSKGTLDIYVGGTTAGTFGDLAVSNGASLGGTLTIKLVNGFVPVVGNSFTILTGSAVSGTFAKVNGTSINSGEHFEVNYTGTAVTLTVVSGL
jgi:hypothetical protein